MALKIFGDFGKQKCREINMDRWSEDGMKVWLDWSSSPRHDQALENHWKTQCEVKIPIWYLMRKTWNICLFVLLVCCWCLVVVGENTRQWNRFVLVICTPETARLGQKVSVMMESSLCILFLMDPCAVMLACRSACHLWSHVMDPWTHSWRLTLKVMQMSLGEKATLDITSDFAYLGCERESQKSINALLRTRSKLMSHLVMVWVLNASRCYQCYHVQTLRMQDASMTQVRCTEFSWSLCQV